MEVDALDLTDHTTSSLADWLLIGFPVALCLAHGSGLFIFSSYTSRMALLVAAGVPGLVALADLVRRGDRAGRVALLVGLWIVVAAMFSGAPLLAMKGTVGRELTGVTVIAALGVWALGRQASRTAAAKMPIALLVGVGINAAVGVAQVAFQIETGWLAMQFSRATGLTSNPVYFGALMAGGAGLAAGWPDWTLSRRIVVVFGFAFAANLSGSRVALVAGLTAVALVLVAREDTIDRARRVLIPVGYIFGTAAAGWFTSSLPGARGSTERVTEVGSGGRADAWRYGLHAVTERPIFGSGFGRFRASTQGQFSAEFVRTAASDDLRQAWFDAHNVVVNTVVAIGVVGLGLSGWFVVRAVRGADRHLLLFLAGIVLTWTMQPVGLVTLPLAMFTLGVAGVARQQAVAPTPHMNPVWYQGAALVGVLLAGWLVTADLAVKRAVDRSDAGALERAAVLYPGDSVVADLVAQGLYAQVQFEPSLGPDVLTWSQRSIDNEPDRPYYWRRHAQRLFAFGQPEAARAALERAVELEPWHLQSWQGLAAIAQLTGDDELLTEATAKLCELGQPMAGC